MSHTVTESVSERRPLLAFFMDGQGQLCIREDYGGPAAAMALCNLARRYCAERETEETAKLRSSSETYRFAAIEP